MTSQQPVPYPLRMPEDLRAQLNERAKINGRSLNAEIIAILQHAVDPSQSPMQDVNAFAEDIAQRVANKLKGK